MDDKTESPSAGTISERDLMIGAYVVAIGLVGFAIGYWGGRDIGSLLFN